MNKETKTERVGRLWYELQRRDLTVYIDRQTIWDLVLKGLTDDQIYQKAQTLDTEAQFLVEHQDDLPRGESETNY